MGKLLLYGITGAKGHGKSTLAEMIQKAEPAKNWRVLSFADPLKRMSMEIFDLEEKYVYDPEWKEKPLGRTIYMDEYLGEMAKATGLNIKPHGCVATTSREIQQFLGTEYVRFEQDNYWASLLMETIKGNGWTNVAIPDMRFINEQKILEKHNGVLIRVVRIGKEDTKFVNHLSETESKNIPVLMEFHFKDGELSLMKHIATLLANGYVKEAARYDYWYYKARMLQNPNLAKELLEAVNEGKTSEEVLSMDNRALLRAYHYYNA